MSSFAAKTGDAATSAMKVGPRYPRCATVLGCGLRVCVGFHHFSQFGHIAALFVSPGTYVKADCDGNKGTQCEPCQQGFYTATKNHMSSCHLCRACSRSESCSTALELLNTHMDTHAHTCWKPATCTFHFFFFYLQPLLFCNSLPQLSLI